MADSASYKETLDKFQVWANNQHLPQLNFSDTTTLAAGLPGHHHGYKTPTLGQLTLFLLWLTAIVLWLLRVPFRKKLWNKADADQDVEAQANGPVKLKSDSQNDETVIPEKGTQTALNGDVLEKIENGDAVNAKTPDGILKEKEKDKTNGSNNDKNNKERQTFTKFKPPPSLDNFLYYVVIFGGIMFYFYLCDYQHIFPAGERIYSRDLFLFLLLILFLVTTGFTIKSTEDKLINRDQTEEWRGWMQVMFVWYHYFAAKETYNYIRIFIACYVWMTGFGNFSFFWIRKDFSIWRMLKMLWRLNFLVVIVAVVTNNQYMMYYICAMHTYWFFTVYAFMRILNSWNTDPKKMAVKFAAYFVINLIIFDVPGVGKVVFWPFMFVLSYQGSSHEWLFRAGLDHYATIIGMLCAYNYPRYEKFIKWLEKKDDPNHYKLGLVIKLIIGVAFGVALFVWHWSVMGKEKYSYNRVHPYTSFIPILAFVYFRNLFPALRSRYLHLLAWLGKITLETYISQLHVYMQSGAKELIVYIPGYPLVNFALATAVYICIAYWLFQMTTEFSAFLLPQDMKKVGINFIIAVVLCGFYAVLGLCLRELKIF